MVHKGESIQSSVDAASDGTIILVEGGIYKEAILVKQTRNPMQTEPKL
jgi:hypothetical protein